MHSSICLDLCCCKSLLTFTCNRHCTCLDMLSTSLQLPEESDDVLAGQCQSKPRTVEAFADAHLSLEAVTGIQSKLQAVDDVISSSLVRLQVVAQLVWPLLTCHLQHWTLKGMPVVMPRTTAAAEVDRRGVSEVMHGVSFQAQCRDLHAHAILLTHSEKA